MKKIALVLAGLLACGSVFADESVLFVNTDSDSKLMTVSYKICD